MILGRRITWVSSDELHWEMRRGFTIFAYSSSRFADFLRTQDELLRDLKISPVSEKADQLITESYRMSCYKLLEARLGFYESSLPASSYRRTSIDFDMARVNKLSINAYADKDNPSTIIIHDGTVLAVEDAAQSVLAQWVNPLGLDIGIGNPLILRGGQLKASTTRPFVDYEHLSDPSPAVSEIGALPKIISGAFVAVPDTTIRQIFADHASTMALLWIVGHEDAHKYCGHLDHFHLLGFSEQDRLYDELASSIFGEDATNARRSAELQADTCSTMRAVDYCFDAEFLGIVSDWIPHSARRTLWSEGSESTGLTSHQRCFLMRLIAFSCVLPLAIFSIATLKNSSVNTRSYPPFLTRALNAIFTIASRSVDVSLNQPANLTGAMGMHELLKFIELALHDFAEVTAIFHKLVGVHEPSTVGVRPEALAYPLFLTLLGYHNQGNFLEIVGQRGSISAKDLGKHSGPVVEFMLERNAMDIARVKTFATSQYRVNQGRREKVDEDISIANDFIRRTNQMFTFI
jgi:hypothetical protein